MEKNSSEEIYFELMSVAPKNDPVYSKNLQESGLGSFHRLWQKIDDKYLGPIFGTEEKIDNKVIWEKIWADEDSEVKSKK